MNNFIRNSRICLRNNNLMFLSKSLKPKPSFMRYSTSRMDSNKSRKAVVNVTESACSNLQRIAKEYNTNRILFSIKGGGCNGFNYLLEPLKNTDMLDTRDEKVPISENCDLYVCHQSLIHLLGTQIDWRKTVMGESFHFENPMADSKCGCGTSFTSKVFHD